MFYADIISSVLTFGMPQTTHTIILTDSMSLLQKVKSEMGISPDWIVLMVDIRLKK